MRPYIECPFCGDYVPSGEYTSHYFAEKITRQRNYQPPRDTSPIDLGELIATPIGRVES